MGYLSEIKQDQLSNYICGLFDVSDRAKKEEIKAKLKDAYVSFGIAPKKDAEYALEGQMSLFEDDYER